MLFVYRVSKHYFIKYFPSKLLYNQEPVLPMDVKYKLPSTENSDAGEPFDKEIFDTVGIF